MASSFKKRTVIARSLRYSLKKLDYQRRYSLNRALWEIQLQQQYQCDGLSERAAKMLLEYAEWLIIIRGYESMEYSEELALAFMTYQLEQYVDLMRGTNGKGPKLTKTLSEVAWKAEKEFFSVFGGIDLGTRWDVKVMDLQGVIAVSPGDWNAPAVEDWKSLIRSLLSVESSVEPQPKSESHESESHELGQVLEEIQEGESQEVEEETDETLTRETAFEPEEKDELEENLEDGAISSSMERNKLDKQRSLPVDPLQKEVSRVEDQVRDGISPERVGEKKGVNYHHCPAEIDSRHHLDDKNMEKLESSRTELMDFLDEVYDSDKKETASEEGIIKHRGTYKDMDSHGNNVRTNYTEGTDENEKIQNSDQDMDVEEIEEEVYEIADQDMDNDQGESRDLDLENCTISGVDTTINDHSAGYDTPDGSPFIDITIPIPSSIQASQTEVQNSQPEHQICVQSEKETSPAFESQINFQEISIEDPQPVNEDQAAGTSQVFAISSRQPSLSVPISSQASVDLQDSSVPTHSVTLPPDGKYDDNGENEDTLSTSNSRVEVRVPQMLMVQPSMMTNDQPTISQSFLEILSMISESSLRDQLSKLSTLSELVDEANTVIQEFKSNMASGNGNEETFITKQQVNSLLSSMEKSEKSSVKSVLDILDLRLGKIVQDICCFKDLIPTIKFIELESMRTSQIIKEDHDIFGSSIRGLKANLDSLLQMHGDAMRFTESHINGLGGKTQQLACALSAMEARLKTDHSNKSMQVQNEISRLTNHFTQLGKNTLRYVQETKAAFQKFQPRLDSALKLSTDVKRDLEAYVADDKSKILEERLKAVETNVDEISFSNMKEVRKVKEENMKLKEENKKVKEENLNLNRKISLLERKMDDHQKAHEANFKDLITEVSDTISRMKSTMKNMSKSPRTARLQGSPSRSSAGQFGIPGSQDSDGLRNNYTLSLPLATSEQQTGSPRVSSQRLPTRPFITAPSDKQGGPSSSTVARAPLFKQDEEAITSTGRSPHRKEDVRKRIPNPQSTVSLVDSLFNNAPPRGVKRQTPPSRPLNFNENIDLKKIKLLKPNSS
jgi:hypothetical protein